MRQQLIFCVESHNSKQSDYIYIKKLIDYFYVVDYANTKLSVVGMSGKGNYNQKKTINEIHRLGGQYQYTQVKGQSCTYVFFCFDCDDYDTDPADRDFIIRARQYCLVKNYRFVWFCKDIESVFLGKQVADNQKKREAEAFAQRKQIEQIDIRSLMEPGDTIGDYRNKRSNLCNVLDEYLERK